MKRLVYLGLIMLTGSTFSTFAQESDSTGMPGDHFDLQAALELFKQSSNLEDFEKKLNTESTGVNNLDLDGNNVIDYIRVIDKKEGDNHAIILQVPVNSKENQDIAAIVIEKRSSNEAQLQIIGNETIYGEEKIMEPVEEKEIKRSGGPAILAPTTFVFVNVWGWPCVQYIYAPYYDPWYSPYYWDYYPYWWDPWRPVYWHVYYQRVYYYHGWCQYTTVYHVPNAHAVYVSHHSNSNYVRKRYEPQRTAYKGRAVNNQSANGSKGRVETGSQGTINTQGKRPAVRTEGTLKSEPKQPVRSTVDPKVRKEAPRPVNPNNRGTINNGERNNGTTVRPAEPVKRTPTVRPQQRTPNPPQRVEPQPRQNRPVVRPSTPNRPVVKPSNGGGGQRRGR